MSASSKTGLTLALEDVFDRPGEAAAAGTEFLPRVREAYPGGSPMLTELRRAGIEAGTVRPSIQFAAGDKGSQPLALAVTEKRATVGLGLDEGGWLRLAAARHGLHGLRFFHEDWLGRGCVALAPSVGAVGCLAAARGDLIGLGRALLGKSFSTGMRPGRILDIGPVLQLEGGLPAAYTKLMTQWGADNDIETAAWLLERWHGAELAQMVLASREAAERLRPWLSGNENGLSTEFLHWLETARDWGEAAVQSAHRKQSEIAAAFREVFQNHDAIATPFVDGMTFADGGLALPRLAMPVDVARMAVCVVPLAQGHAVQLIFPDVERLVIP